MNKPPRARALAVLLAVLIAVGVMTSVTACDPVSRDWAWKAGKTHGAVIETTAGRASLAIYRVPSRALYGVMQKRGTTVMQGFLWHYGKPPALKQRFTYRGHSVTLELGTATSALRTLTYKLIYDDPSDLKAALRDAHRADACLALTLISYGKPTSNWTQKQAGCQDGAI